jgi:hypothetical protein
MRPSGSADKLATPTKHKHAHSHHQGHGHGILSGVPSSILYGLVAIGSMLVVGMVFTIVYFPTDQAVFGGPSTNSIVSKAVREVRVIESEVQAELKAGLQAGKAESVSLSKKLMNWLPIHHWGHMNSGAGTTTEEEDEEDIMPDYGYYRHMGGFWTPIDIDTISYDPVVTLCRLEFQEYSESPHLYPMFRDLQQLSKCHGNNKRTETLSALLADIRSRKPDDVFGRVIEPSGFVFHESRVGSTLVANALGSDPWNLVYSESSPSANALLHCDNCDEARSIQLFRDMVTVMGRTPFHKRLFLKFQSITATKMDIALKAFPNTSWVFVYRSPVQTVMSHLDPKKEQSGAPCLRSMRDPPPEVCVCMLAGFYAILYVMWVIIVGGECNQFIIHQVTAKRSLVSTFHIYFFIFCIINMCCSYVCLLVGVQLISTCSATARSPHTPPTACSPTPNASVDCLSTTSRCRASSLA